MRLALCVIVVASIFVESHAVIVNMIVNFRWGGPNGTQEVLKNVNASFLRDTVPLICHEMATTVCGDFRVKTQQVQLPTAATPDLPLRMLVVEQTERIDKFWFVNKTQHPVAAIRSTLSIESQRFHDFYCPIPPANQAFGFIVLRGFAPIILNCTFSDSGNASGTANLVLTFPAGDVET